MKLTKDKYAELVDRAYVMVQQFDLIIAEHPAGDALPTEVEKVQLALWEMYQSAGALYSTKPWKK